MSVQASDLSDRALVVLELDLWLIQQADIEVETEVAVGRLDKGKRRAPTVEVPLQAQEVRVQINKGTVMYARGFKDRVSAVKAMIIHRQHHGPGTSACRFRH